MTVNPSTMRLGIASILVGLVGAYGVRVMMEEEEAPPAAVTVEKFLVPLANQDLPAGRIIRKGDISFRKLDADTMKQEGMPLDLVMMAADQIISRQLRKQVRLGEPFLTTSVYLEAGGPKYELKPGYRAVSVSVSMSRGGYAEANDVVDVYFTSTPKGADAKTGQRAIPMKTIPLVDAVTVLEVTRPESTANAGYQGTEVAFLLQVLPDQVAKFQALQGHGVFSLMIRSKDDVAIKDTDQGTTLEDILGLAEEKPPREQPYWFTEVYRAGSRGGQHFPIAVPTPEQMAEMQRRYNEEQAKLGAAGGNGQQPEAVTDASPVDSAPVAPPVRRRPTPTLREPEPINGSGAETTPQVPYRASEPVSAPPTRPAVAPLPQSAGNATDSADPFGDDPQGGEVLP